VGHHILKDNGTIRVSETYGKGIKVYGENLKGGDMIIPDCPK